MRSRLLRLVLPVFLAAAASLAVAGWYPGESGGEGGVATPPLSAGPAVKERPPVVMLVLDEFPIDVVLGPDGKIDAGRYPNLASLASTSTWFRNAHTVYDSTTKATPAILDAQMPEAGTQPTYEDHPRSVYDLFGRRGYRIVRSEEASSVCPPRWCRGARAKTPPVLDLLLSGRAQRLGAFFRRIRPGPPTLYFKHALLPHGPHFYLPSGRRARASAAEPLPGMETVPGFADAGLTDFNRQRMLLQIGFVDRQLGRLFSRMRRNGTFDRSMVVITADHGIASDVGVTTRRRVSSSTADEVAPVPLFIKRPGQTAGSVSRTIVRTVDIVPTMADMLGLRMPYRADGRSALSRSVRRRRTFRVQLRELTGTVVLSRRTMERRRHANVRRNLRRFGHGNWASLHERVGPNPELVGRAVAELPVRSRAGAARAAIVGGRALASVGERSDVRPTQLAGPIAGGRRGARRNLAVAVNGRVEAVGRTFYLTGSRQESFALNVPEESLRPGRNSVRLFQVNAAGRQLIPIPLR